MRQCGLENFTIEVVEECQSQEQLNSRERFWIRVLKCKVPNGYNQNNGGGGSIHKPRFSLMVGNNIKQLREELGLTQQKFAERIGVGQQSVAAIENGGTVTERNFNAICAAFNVNPEWLRCGTGEIFMPATLDTYLDKVAAEKNLSAEDRALIESVLELPSEARKSVIAWAEKLVAKLHVKTEEQAKADERRRLEKTITDAQQRLAELDGAKSWGEESSIKAGQTFWSGETENSA